MKKITVLIPCYNEEKGVAKVINSIPKAKLKKLGFSVEVLVMDNNSTDKTAQVARKAGARVIFEGQRGKGNNIRAGFRSISKDTDYVIMLDGDATYHAEEIPRLIEPLESGFCDVILGSRLEGKTNTNAMSYSHRLANWGFTFLVRKFYYANVTDVCTGFFAWKASVVRKLNGYIVSPGFAIETEMVTKMAKMGFKLYSVPITYSPRHGESKIAPVGDGIRIIRMNFKNLNWKPKS